MSGGRLPMERRSAGGYVARYPLLALLDPRAPAVPLLLALSAGLAAWGGLVWAVGMPIWGATTVLLAAALPVGVRKWRADLAVWGPATTVLGVLVVLQGFHSLEHVVQWVQYHVLYQPPSQSSGLISAANVEWVHFVWNWIVVTLLVGLARGGVRNRWSWLLLAWAGAHAAEHTYMMVRYLQMKQELAGLGVPSISAQGLPGFFGRDGWLARGPVTQNTFLCRIPVATTTSRLDVHFWWNTGEILLLAAAAHVHLRRQFRSG